MKKQGNFLEKYWKWIVRILVVIWIGLILKLFLMWLEISRSCWGWYISLCMWINIDYHWSILSTVTFILLIISTWLLFVMKTKKQTKTKIIIALIIFVLWIFSKQILFVFSKDFKFYLTDMSDKYIDENWNFTDLDLYLELVTKYCKSDRYDEIAHCGWKMIYDFNTIEEYKKALDYFNKHDYKDMYTLTYNSIEDNVWLENMIREYDDVTFYCYLLKDEWDNNWIVFNIKSNSSNEWISNLINNITNLLLKAENEKFKDFYEERKYWDDISKDIDDKIKQIPAINTNILY